MSSNKKFITLIFFIITSSLSISGEIKENKTQRYVCPAELILGESRFALDGLGVFDGPVENMVELVPEFLNNDYLATWNLYHLKNSFIKCKYKEVDHYISIRIGEAEKCTAHSENNVYKTVMCK